MPAALAALGNEGRRAEAGHQLRHGDGGHDRDDLDSGIFPELHVFRGVARAGRHDGDTLLCGHLRNFIRERTHEHDVDTEGLFRQGFGNLDLLAHIVCRGVARSHDAEATAASLPSAIHAMPP